MAAREYVGTGGTRIHLDEPLSLEMAKQVAAGRLMPVHGNAPDVEAGDKSLVVVHGSEAQTANRVGVHRRGPGARPEGGGGKEWATYAVSLGLLATQAATMSVQQLREWVEAHEEALGEQVQAPVPQVDAGSPDAVVPHPVSGPPQDLQRPAKAAQVGDWRAYVIALGVDPDEAKAMTKTQAQERADALEQAREDNAALDQQPADDGSEAKE